MRQSIKAEERELKHIFSDEYVFEIPEYQRPYSWTTEQTSELLDDLLSAADEETLVENASPYFLGSIVLIKDSDSPVSHVVDGQQRLTTLTILLCILRDLSTNDKSKRSLDQRVREEGDPLTGTADRFRLSLRDRDRLFFREKVQGGKGIDELLKQKISQLSDSRKRLHENTAYLSNKLAGLDQAVRDKLAGFMLQRCYLVAVSTSDRESAYRIFSVMNDRGMNLSATDIFKAEIIGEIPANEREGYTERWENTEERLGRDAFLDLFVHLRMIYVRAKAKRSLVHEFKPIIIESGAQEFIDNVIVPYAEDYETITTAKFVEAQDAPKVNRLLIHLNRLDNQDWIPPAMRYLRANSNNGGAMLRFLKSLECLAYKMFVTRAYATVRIQRYGEILKAIESGADLHDPDSILQLSKAEKKDFIEALNGPIYEKTRVRLPILLRLDAVVAEASASYDHSTISIEHVLPQNPKLDSEWLEWFDNEEERDNLTHKLANLVLLSRIKNSQAGNFDFERKKREYFTKKGTSPFALTSQVLQHKEWTPDVLKKRQKKLINALKQEWALS